MEEQKNKSMRVISIFGKGINALEYPGKCNGIIGLSIDYPFFQEINLYKYLEKYFESKELKNYIKWSLKIFDKIIIYTSDWLLHYNLMAFEGLNKKKALKTAKIMGDFIEDKCNKIISAFKTQRVQLFRWSAKNENKKLNKTIKKIRSFSFHNNQFNYHCLELTLTATHNKLKIVKKKYGNNYYKKALGIAQKYAVDDIALLVYLYKYHHCISISKYEPPKPVKYFIYGFYPRLYKLIKLKPNEIGHIQVITENCKARDSWYDDKYEKLVEKNGK